MRATLTLLLLILAGGETALHAQVDYNARVGATWATALVRDDIINEIEVQQKLAPTLVLGVALPIAPLYRAGLELALATSGYQSKEDGGETVDLGTLRTGTITLGLDGPVSQWPSLAGRSRTPAILACRGPGDFSPRWHDAVSRWRRDRLPASNHG